MLGWVALWSFIMAWNQMSYGEYAEPFLEWYRGLFFSEKNVEKDIMAFGNESENCDITLD